jgi:molecular chaperone DnaJ
MADKRDYYEVLGVERTADADTIKRAYRKLAMQHHPDKNPGDKAAEEKFKEAAEAYGVLSDEAQKKRYDQFGHQAFSQGGEYAGPQFTNIEDIFEAFGGSIFGDIFGGGGRRRSGPRQGRSLKIQVELTLEEIDKGVKRTISLKRKENCTPCKGSGCKPGTGPTPCKTCGGRGQVHRNQGFFTMAAPCPSCRGAGQTIESPCGTCRGAGKIDDKADIEIPIPAGVEDGMTLRVEGQGDAGESNAPRGDLYVVVREVEHKSFQREGADLICALPFAYTQLVLGDKVEIPTLRGKTSLSIPAGTPAGKMIRLKGEGLPHIEGRGRGDLHVRVDVEIPTKLTDRQKDLLKEYAEIEKKSSGGTSFFDKIRNML